ncbi:MAG: tetratricopeptide repeat protein [Agathobacter sp.]|nr:tetratricopeptide repeat protein [Lachnobacterium sp.]MDY2910919.1 tetratricopeptide repeat protein [Agathobacter sp.]
MICYRCGGDAGRNDICPHCNADIKIFQKVERASNSYYNDGLQKAQVRNLSGAIISLRQALKLYKYNTQARNLLGLVYYEMGEVVDALSEWVISANYKPEDNLAINYLREIKENRSQLDAVNQTIKKYNQALLYCRQDSRDLAIIQLKKVLSLNPKLVKGHQLLALLYMQEKQPEKAKRALRDAGRIDTDNTTTLRYLKEVNRQLKEKGKDNKPKNDDLISYQSGNETIIMPKRFRESSLGGTLGYILIGLIVGVAATVFLIVPGVKSKIKEDAKNSLLDANDTISNNAITISDLERQIEDLQNQIDESESKDSEEKAKTAAYEDLLNAYVAYTSEDTVSAGSYLEKIDSSMLSGQALETYNTINDSVSATYLEDLYNEAYGYYTAYDYENAAKSFQKIVDQDESYRDGSAAYYLAQSYRKLEKMEDAKKYYQYILDNYPGTEKANTAANYVDAQ